MFFLFYIYNFLTTLEEEKEAQNVCNKMLTFLQLISKTPKQGLTICLILSSVQNLLTTTKFGFQGQLVMTKPRI